MKSHYSIILVILIVVISGPVFSQISIEWTNHGESLPTSCASDDALCSCTFMPPVNFGELETPVDPTEPSPERTIDITMIKGTGNFILDPYTLLSGNLSNWELSFNPAYPDATSPIVVPSGTPIVLTAKFKPMATAVEGNDIVVLSFATTDCALPSCEIPITCAPTCSPCLEDADETTDVLDLKIRLVGVVKRSVLNFSLVLDRSGSMSTMEDDGVSDTERRIDILSDAVQAFINIANNRKENPAISFPGDKLSMVKYDNIVDSYMALQTLTTSSVSTADSKVNLVATNDLNQIAPRGLTATGNAVIEALKPTHLPPSTTDEGKVIILFSDGYENSGYRVDDPEVINAVGGRSDVFIYSVGMGSANNAVLQQYSNLSGLITPQFFEVTNSTVDLSLAYAKIYQDALNYQGVHDPVYHVNLMDSSITYISEAMITSSDRKAIFSIIHPRKIKGLASFQLISPSGKILDTGSVDGLETRVTEGRNHTIYHVVFAENADAADYVGNWTLQIIGVTKSRLAQADVNISNLTNVPIGFSVMAASNLTFDFDIGAGGGQPGDILSVSSNFVDGGTSGSVQIDDYSVTIQRPDGRKDVLRPQIDAFGTYSASYPHTQLKGLYKIKANALVRNAKGELATRDAVRYVVINTPKKYTSVDEPCLSCNYIKAIIAISIILLIIILIVVIRRRRP